MSAPDALAGELRRRVAKAQSENRLPSVSAAVFRDGDVMWAEAIGLADIEERRDATPETQYMIGSITKTFTAAAVMQLRDAGAVSLDDPIGTHLEELPHRTPTLRQSLAHLSALQREIPGTGCETLTFPTREELLANLGDVEQVLAPGERWHYSNLAYVLLGEVVERLSGVPYMRYVEERLLQPLGLERTTFAPVEPAARGYYVHPYADTALREPSLEKDGAAAAGALWSTTGDLVRWATFLADPDEAVLSRKSADAMHAFHALADTHRWSYGWGLGLILWRAGERVLAGHSGATVGFLASLFYSREERVGAVALTNASTPSVMEELTVSLAVETLERAPVEPQPWLHEEPPPPEIERLLGPWWSEGSQTIFRYRRGRLEAVLADDRRERPPSVFEQEEPDVFRVVSGREQGELLRVVRDEQGEPVKLYWATYPFFRAPGSWQPREQ